MVPFLAYGLMFVLIGWGNRLQSEEPVGAPITLRRFVVGVGALASGALWLALMAVFADGR